MASSILDSSYYRDMFGTADMRRVFSDEQRFQSWLDVEVALAFAEERSGVIPESVAGKIKDAAKLENIDIEEMKDEFDQVGFPILPFVHQLANACDAETARWVHYGSTTQDILDTGIVLQMKAGVNLIEDDLRFIIQSLAKLANDHRNTVMAGRTFQQLAAPITFGYKVAVWMDELLRHMERIDELKKRVFVGQCAGAVGTFATLGEKGSVVQREMMKELGLGVPSITWHTSRDGWAELLACLGMVAATLGKIATEISILMRTEVAEVSEPYQHGRGASSTLPQKRNPIECQPIIAIAHRLRELVSSQMSAMIQEHERSVGPMHLEWMIIPEAFILLSGSLHHARNILPGLEVNDQRMRENLEIGGGLLMSEAVMMGLASKIGRNKAHDLVYGVAANARGADLTLRQALLNNSEIMQYITEEKLDELLDPVNYTGSAGKMIDNVIKKVNRMNG